MHTDWLSKNIEGVQPSFLSWSNDRLKTKNNTILRIRIGDLLTNAKFTVVEYIAIYVLLGAAVMDKKMLAILPDDRN